VSTYLPSRLLCGLTLVGLAGVAGAQQAAGNAAGALPAVNMPQLDYWELRAQETEELYIPRAAQRPLGEDAGPRIQVTQIRLDVDEQLERRVDAELAGRLNRMLAASVTENLAEGFTIGRLENIAAQITNELRDAGFILAWAFLPEQNVVDSSVTITVLPGSLNAISTDGNVRYPTERLIEPFSDLIGSPVQRDAIESSIMRVRNYPGLSTSAVFSPGDETGTSQLTLRVAEDPFDMTVMADNHGTESSGENRLRADLFWYNPFKRGDLITINLLQTFDPAENLYGGIEYETPIFRPDLAFRTGYSHNTFEVAQGIAAGAGEDGKNLAGDTDIAWIGFRKNTRLTRRSRMDFGFDLATKRAQLFNLGTVTEDNLTVASLAFSAEAVDGIGAGGINQFELFYSRGIADFLGSMDETGDGGQSTRSGGSGVDAGGDFGKWSMRYQRLQRISRRNSLLVRAEGQMTDDLLVSVEQFVLGGPNSVRAYPIAEYLADEGAFASLEWILDVSKSDSDTSVSLSAFADYAYGKLNDPLPSEIDDTDLGGWGLGFSVSHLTQSGSQFALRLEAATPITNIDPSDGDDTRFFGRISYTFR
jgi:hemolysin activation/secretion protein